MPAHYDAKEDAPLKKSRYKATQEKNQLIARKKADATPAAQRRAKANKKNKPASKTVNKKRK